jgi:hypothetical protein
LLAPTPSSRSSPSLSMRGACQARRVLRRCRLSTRT